MQFEKWNGQKEIASWNNHSEIVHGTSGYFFQPFLKGSEKLWVWVPEMYRAMPLRKESEADLDDVHMFRYRIVRAIDRSCEACLYVRFHRILNSGRKMSDTTVATMVSSMSRAAASTVMQVHPFTFPLHIFAARIRFSKNALLVWTATPVRTSETSTLMSSRSRVRLSCDQDDQKARPCL